jgi:16S rRNA (guanine966-N2)-methyltransferase
MSTLRVIGGKARGLRINTVPGNTTRPITDRVKEALFNILGPDIVDATLLDLFGGTGAVSIEALSRGARFARLVELSRPAVNIIKANLEHTDFIHQAEVLNMDAFVLLRKTPDKAYDYIYVAPPQYKGMWQKAMQEIDANMGWLSEESWVIVQIHPIEYEALVLQHLVEFDQRDYGSTILVFFERI